MVSSFEKTYMKLAENHTNRDVGLFFINTVLCHNEIKAKLCEKLLIDCRFARPSANAVVNENSKYLKYSQSNDNNELIFNYLISLLVRFLRFYYSRSSKIYFILPFLYKE
jgi:hypothetical protein